jgi:hypothetical protein
MNIVWVWAIFNLCIGMYEIYVYKNKHKLRLNQESIWNKCIWNKCIWNKCIWNKKSIHNIFIEAWNDYCKVDSRYIYKHYVWIFELLNAGLSVLFIIALFMNKKICIKNILFLQIINCSLYFLTLVLEMLYNKSFVETIKTYAKTWMIPVYYGISLVWIFIPYYLYSRL